MATRDLRSLIKPVVAVNYTHVTGNGSTVGNIIDMQGYESATFLFNLMARTDGTYTPTIEHGDDSGLSDAAVVTSDFLVGTVADVATALSGANTIASIGYVGKKRYVRVTMVASLVTTGGYIGASVIKGDAHRNIVEWNG